MILTCNYFEQQIASIILNSYSSDSTRLHFRDPPLSHTNVKSLQRAPLCCGISLFVIFLGFRKCNYLSTANKTYDINSTKQNLDSSHQRGNLIGGMNNFECTKKFLNLDLFSCFGLGQATVRSTRIAFSSSSLLLSNLSKSV